ncbi:UDP-N-acetylglucosamine pyrophosphorylase /glucosamine-1-phosphate N-acetyltransferase [Litoreibacter ponti]|uniref:Bifunctional protein GlmU n=1 Tax=Litoreibacter ponti TaxID=1510457 RepID=A0A2T6BKJ7_9RHOB|nr:bifunctional UDP-N-acetylglucosamine diphosphorylase/glucosamine-1-phosphate N-acetyltransferase GlmU [Litoreibacter ponti]PTX56581.1 UDP-N-acetylglucosamine pyrophosphorylase /glucosamine-1-phosphate N-acetyltransferase [Litoreibacter ponti]
MSRPTALILLAAGQGSRMNSELPKVLHQIGGAPLAVHALSAGAALEPAHVVVVTGHGADQVEAALSKHDDTLSFARQVEQNGTAHAVDQARAALEGFEGDAVVLYGDTPFVSGETLERMAEARAEADVVVLGFEAAVPGRYGRLITDGAELVKIVEAKDATDDELAVTLCNSGVVMCDAATLFGLIAKVGNENASGEYYLTDIVEIARADGMRATVVACDEAETLGINTRAELAAAEAAFQARKRAEALENGVTLAQPETTYFALDTVLGRDAVIGPQVVFGPGVTVESGAEIKAFCHLEGCHVAQGAVVGPYARLRPGAELEEGAKVGNFVEIKNATLAEGAKVNHLSYVGDASVGAGANVGAGTITCNYDGVFKHRTKIGAGAFIGSNTLLVAPVEVGAEAMTGSGTVVTDDVPDGDLALSRPRQINKAGFARKLMAMLRAKKMKKDA